MGRLLLDLPTTCPRRDALDSAATELHERGVRGWRNLELHTTDPTGTALIRQFTFTYWHSAATAIVPQAIGYHALWTRLDHPERTALLRLGPASTVTVDITEALTRAGGVGLLVRGVDGRDHLPRSFRLFLRAIATETR